MLSFSGENIKDRVIRISENTHLSMDTKYTTCKIELTGKCTLDCSFCYNRYMKTNNIRQKMITDEDFHIVLENIKSLGTIKEIGLFYMGESSLHKSLDLYFRLCKENNFFTYFTTNATYIENTMKAIPYIDSLKVSWNYKDKEDFAKKTNGNQSLYNRIIKNILLLREECKRNGKFLTLSTIMDSNKEDYEESLNVFKDIEHYWLPLQTQCGINKQGIGAVSGEFDHMVKSIPCWSLFKGLYIDVDLNVRCCCYGHKEEHIIGSLHKNSLKNILLNKKLEEMKMNHLSNNIPEECKECLLM